MTCVLTLSKSDCAPFLARSALMTSVAMVLSGYSSCMSLPATHSSSFWVLVVKRREKVPSGSRVSSAVV